MKRFAILLALPFVLATSAKADFVPTDGLCGNRCRLRDEMSGLTWSKTQWATSYDGAVSSCALSGGRLPTTTEVERAVQDGLLDAYDPFVGFGTTRGTAFWVDGPSRCAVTQTQYGLQTTCNASASSYRCVYPYQQVAKTAPGQACSNTMTQKVPITLSDGRVVYEMRSVTNPSLRDRAAEMRNRGAHQAQEDDRLAAQIFVRAYAGIDRFASAAERLGTLPFGPEYDQTRREMRSAFEQMQNDLASAETYIRLPPQSTLFSLSEVDDLRCEATHVLRNAFDPGLDQMYSQAQCPENFVRKGGVLCVNDNTNRTIANARGSWWDVIGWSGNDLILSSWGSGQQFTFAPDELRPTHNQVIYY